MRIVIIGGEEFTLETRGKIGVVKPTKEHKPLETACQLRGESLGSINCGCGSVSRETEVFACPLFDACTITALGGKAGWLKLNLAKRPAYCRTCEERTP